MPDLIRVGTSGFGTFRLDPVTGQVFHDPSTPGGWPEGVTEDRVDFAVRDAAGAVAFGAAAVDVTRPAALYPGLVGLWKLGDVLGSALDRSANDLTATLADNGDGSITVATNGGRSVARFAGAASTARYTLGSTTAADPISLAGEAALTVIFRASLSDAPANGGRRIIDRATAGLAAGGWAVWASTGSGGDGVLAIGVDGAAVASTAAGSLIPRDATARTYGVSAANGSQSFYREGALMVSEAAVLPVPPVGTAGAAIGNWDFASDRQWAGDIDYVAVFDRVLSATEHADIAADPSLIGA